MWAQTAARGHGWGDPLDHSFNGPFPHTPHLCPSGSWLPRGRVGYQRDADQVSFSAPAPGRKASAHTNPCLIYLSSLYHLSPITYLAILSVHPSSTCYVYLLPSHLSSIMSTYLPFIISVCCTSTHHTNLLYLSIISIPPFTYPSVINLSYTYIIYCQSSVHPPVHPPT